MRKLARGPHTLVHAFLLLAVVCVLLGCDKKTPPEAPASHTDRAKASATSVPLRVWFVGEESRQGLVQRQWQAASERPLELRMLTSTQLLEAGKCESDVVVFPAHLLGELISRQWLVELPSSLSPATSAPTHPNAGSAPLNAAYGARSERADPSLAPAGNEPVPARQPAAWIDQAKYGASHWGVSLGASMPVVMHNFDWALPGTEENEQQSAADAKAFWQAAIAALSEKTAARKHDHPPLADADAAAVCDRFLVLLMSIGRRESRFGSLLDPETLKARLSEPDFVASAEIMLELHRLNVNPQTLSGSYQAAWHSLAGQEPGVSIGVPPLPTPEVDKVTSIAMVPPPLSPGLSGPRGRLSERTMGWNSGHGLVASVTAQCRQSSLAVEFMRWLASEPNRNSLARSIVGVSGSSLYAPGSSAWQAQRLSDRIAAQPRVPSEPRLAGSSQYRQALGEQLIRMLGGELEPEAALKAAAAQWDAITASRDQQKLRASYEASLGL